MTCDRSPNQDPGLLIARSFAELPSIRSTQSSVNGGEEQAMSTAELITGDEAADRELVALEKEADQLSRKARLTRNTASKLGRLVEDAKARRAKEVRRAHLGRHVGLSEERYRLEVELEEAMSGLLEGLGRLRKLDANQHKEAQAAGLYMEDRYRSLIAGWLSSRLRGYLPLGEVDEVYWQPLFDADDQNLESEV